MLTWARLMIGGINVFGWAVSSLGLALVILQAMNVFNRYFFAQNQYFGLFTTFYDEVLLVGFSALFMLGSAFAFNRDAHVRVDIVYAGLTPRGQASINFWGIIIFMIPLAWVIFYYSLSNVEQAWKLAESGPNGEDGVTFFWLWKTMVPAFCVLTILGGMAHLVQNFARLSGDVVLTNIVFGVGFIGLGVVGFIAALLIDMGSAQWALPLFQGVASTLDANWTFSNAAWVEFAQERRPQPEYRFFVWALIVWGARLFSLSLVVIGAWSLLRAIAGQMDPDEDDRLLAALDESDAAPMGEA